MKVERKKTCVICGKEFVAVYKNRTVCSDECERERNRRYSSRKYVEKTRRFKSTFRLPVAVSVRLIERDMEYEQRFGKSTGAVRGRIPGGVESSNADFYDAMTPCI